MLASAPVGLLVLLPVVPASWLAPEPLVVPPEVEPPEVEPPPVTVPVPDEPPVVVPAWPWPEPPPLPLEEPPPLPASTATGVRPGHVTASAADILVLRASLLHMEARPCPRQDDSPHLICPIRQWRDCRWVKGSAPLLLVACPPETEPKDPPIVV